LAHNTKVSRMVTAITLALSEGENSAGKHESELYMLIRNQYLTFHDGEDRRGRIGIFTGWTGT